MQNVFIWFQIEGKNATSSMEINRNYPLQKKVCAHASLRVFSIWQDMFKWLSKRKADETKLSRRTTTRNNTKYVCMHMCLCENTAGGWRLSLFENIQRENVPFLFFITSLTAVRAAEKMYSFILCQRSISLRFIGELSYSILVSMHSV